MTLDELKNEKISIVKNIKAYEELQLGLEHISKYNRENYSKDELKVFTMMYEPHLEEITEMYVANKIEKLNNKLFEISKKSTR